MKKTNKNLILISVGIGCQVGGTLCAISGTRNAAKQIKEKEEQLGRKLTKKELFGIAALNYAPTLLLQGAGTGCILVAANNYTNAVNSALLQAGTAYTALNTYKETTKEVLGDKAKQKVDAAVAQKAVDADAGKYEFQIPTESMVALWKEPITGQEFLGTWNEITKAALLATKSELSLWSHVTINDFLRELINQPHTKGLNIGDSSLDHLGWSDTSLVDIYITSAMKDSYPIGMIGYPKEPRLVSEEN